MSFWGVRDLWDQTAGVDWSSLPPDVAQRIYKDAISGPGSYGYGRTHYWKPLLTRGGFEVWEQVGAYLGALGFTVRGESVLATLGPEEQRRLGSIHDGEGRPYTFANSFERNYYKHLRDMRDSPYKWDKRKRYAKLAAKAGLQVAGVAIVDQIDSLVRNLWSDDEVVDEDGSSMSAPPKKEVDPMTLTDDEVSLPKPSQ